METNSLLVVVGGILLGAALVWLLSRTLLYFRPRPERERIIRLEVRARTLHEHVHHAEGERPSTAEEVGDVLFGEADEGSATDENEKPANGRGDISEGS